MAIPRCVAERSSSWWGNSSGSGKAQNLKFSTQKPPQEPVWFCMITSLRILKPGSADSKGWTIMIADQRRYQECRLWNNFRLGRPPASVLASIRSFASRKALKIGLNWWRSWEKRHLPWTWQSSAEKKNTTDSFRLAAEQSRFKCLGAWDISTGSTSLGLRLDIETGVVSIVDPDPAVNDRISPSSINCRPWVGAH